MKGKSTLAVQKALALDWNFAKEGSDKGPHSIHSFPAKFIPQIPRQVLSVFRVPDGTAILDPFAGSGTTLLEAKLGGYDFVGVDINPIAVLISKVKTSDLPPGTLAFANRVVAAAKARFEESEDIPLPTIPRLEHWFTLENARAMVCLRDEISRLECQTSVTDFLRVCLSAITVKISKQESETRYAAVAKGFGPNAVFDLFEKTAHSVGRKLTMSQDLFEGKRGKGSVFCFDSRRIAELRLPKVSLVITSPPYPNAYEYWLYNKYRMYWLGFDPIGVREKEIGARPHYSGPNGMDIEHFVGDIAECFRGISTHLIDEAHIALLVSSKCTIRKAVFDLPPLLKEALEAEGYTFLGCSERTIPRTRKAFNPSIGSIDSEVMLFFQWDRL